MSLCKKYVGVQQVLFNLLFLYSPHTQVLKESGPPHMKSFLTRVTVGEFSAEGEGNSKKLSKKRAAISILQDLKKLPSIPVVEKPKTHYKKRTKTILKVLKLQPSSVISVYEWSHSNYSFSFIHAEGMPLTALYTFRMHFQNFYYLLTK